MKYAVVQLSGKQYKVSEGDTLVVNKIEEAQEGKEFSTSDVLLIANGKDVKIGTPLIAKAVVKFDVLAQQKGDKLRVARYAAKSRYRRVVGHRQRETILKVVSIA